MTTEETRVITLEALLSGSLASPLCISLGLGMDLMGLIHPRQHFTTQLYLTVYPVPLCFWTMESHDKRTVMTKELTHLMVRVVREERGKEEGGAERRREER